jgi:RNA 2',3'-cyclic 3'-phosphodiesterase
VRRPRVVAARVAGGDRLAELARTVETVVVACGFPPDPRGFRPHVTLGRIREGGPGARAPDLSLAGALAPLGMTATRVVLYRSRLLAGGSEYSELMTCELAPA